MRPLPLCLAAALLTSCQPAPADPSAPADTATAVTSEGEPQAPSIPAPQTLVGEYRVAGADGQPIDLGWAMTVRIDGERIALTSQCLTPEWTYSYSGGVLETTPIPKPVCERAYAQVEQAAMAALDEATDARRTPENALVLEGEGGSITLFSQ